MTINYGGTDCDSSLLARFFLEPMVYRADNYGFLYRLLETIKQTTDAEDPENSEANKVSVVLCVT